MGRVIVEINRKLSDSAKCEIAKTVAAETGVDSSIVLVVAKSQIGGHRWFRCKYDGFLTIQMFDLEDSKKFGDWIAEEVGKEGEEKWEEFSPIPPVDDARFNVHTHQNQHLALDAATTVNLLESLFEWGREYSYVMLGQMNMGDKVIPDEHWAGEARLTRVL